MSFKITNYYPAGIYVTGGNLYRISNIKCGTMSSNDNPFFLILCDIENSLLCTTFNSTNQTSKGIIVCYHDDGLTHPNCMFMKTKLLNNLQSDTYTTFSFESNVFIFDEYIIRQRIRWECFE